MIGDQTTRNTSIKLVIFDVDGVLVDIKSSWGFLHDWFGVAEEARRIKALFEKGEIDYVKWMELDTELWVRARRGRLHRSEILEALSRVKILPEAIKVARWVKRKGLYLALVSSGIDLLVRRVAAELGADAWAANRLSFDKQGYLVPGGVPLVGIDKAPTVKRIAWELGVDPGEAVFVGDSSWDASAMKVVGYGIAIGDDPVLARVARFKVKSVGDVRRVLEALLKGEVG